MIFSASAIIIPPEKPAIVRASDLKGLPSWQEMQRRERALREATLPFPVFCPRTAVYATFDAATNANAGTLSGGDLTYTATSASGNNIRSTVSKSSGKWYFEFDPSAGNDGYVAAGVCTDGTAVAGYDSIASVPSTVWLYRDDGVQINNGSSTAFGSNWTTTNLIGVAFDIDAGKLWWAVDGVWQGSGDPAAGTNPAYTGVTGVLKAIIAYFGTLGSPAGTIRFNPASFTQTVPSGFSALSA